jgi:5-methylthioadenosine/S-adenosylhomocysteine deaminase
MLTDEEFDLIAGSSGTLSISFSSDMLMQFGTFPGIGRAWHAESSRGPASTLSAALAPICFLATLDGARVWNLDDGIGSLTPGKQADIAVIDMRSPHLYGFGDPVAVMVLRACPADVGTAIIGGDIMKREGQLVGSHVSKALDLMHQTRDRQPGMNHRGVPHEARERQRPRGPNRCRRDRRRRDSICRTLRTRTGPDLRRLAGVH